MKKRWISLYVENDIGVLARISGLFSGKSYNLNSLTVGTTEDETVSRMTISLISDDKTFEQVKKQLNRSIEVIKVIDFTDVAIHLKEIMFIKVKNCTAQDMAEIFRMAQVFHLNAIDYNQTDVLIESVKTEKANNDLAALFANSFLNRIEIVRGGAAGMEAISISEK